MTPAEIKSVTRTIRDLARAYLQANNSREQNLQPAWQGDLDHRWRGDLRTFLGTLRDRYDGGRVHRQPYTTRRHRVYALWLPIPRQRHDWAVRPLRLED